jgi:hypothetical protein
MICAVNHEKGEEMAIDTLGDRLRDLMTERPAPSIFRCQECGSFLDAARPNPETGRLARKCISCGIWYPVASGRIPKAPAHVAG